MSPDLSRKLWPDGSLCDRFLFVGLVPASPVGVASRPRLTASYLALTSLLVMKHPLFLSTFWRLEASSSHGAKEASGTSVGAVGALEEAASARRRVLTKRLAGAEAKKKAEEKKVQVRCTHAPVCVCVCLCQCLSFSSGPEATNS
jgi:hypothetical protein